MFYRIGALLSFCLTLVLPVPVFGQTDTLALSSGTGTQGGQVTLSLSLTSPQGSEPAGTQWTLGFPASSVASVTAVEGPSALAAGKRISCNPGNGTYTCLLSGMNSNTMLNGVVASITFTLTATASTFAVSVSGTSGVLVDGTEVAVTGTGGTITVMGSQTTLTSIQCVPSSVVGGSSSTCTVTLSGPAPTGGAVVTLSSNNQVVTIPATVTVPAGQTSASVTANTSVVNTVQSAILTAGYAGVFKTTTLTVTPASTLTSIQCVPSTVVGGSSSTCTVTLSGPAPNGGAVVTLSSNNQVVTIPATVTVPAGQTSASVTANTSVVNTVQSAILTAGYAGVFKTTTLTVTPASTLTSIQCVPSTVVGGSSSTCTVTLSGPAPNGGAVVTLSSNNQVVTIPATVTVPAGQTSASVTANTSVVNTVQSAILTAGYAGVFKTTTLTVTPAQATLTSIQCVPSSVVGGSSSTCTVTLSGPAPNGGAVVTLSSNNPVVTIPATVTVPAGQTSASVTANTSVVSTVQAVVITATYSGVFKTTTLTVSPQLTLTSLQCVPSSVVGGQPTTCTVTLSAAAPSGGAVVALSTNNYKVSPPATVTVPAGQVSVPFTATTWDVSTVQSATLTATYAGAFKTTTVTVYPTVQITGLTCSLPLYYGIYSFSSMSSATCTATFASPAGLDQSISISSNSIYLTVPASVAVHAGASAVSFTINSGVIPFDQLAVGTAKAGTSSSSVSLYILDPVISLLCSPATIPQGGSSTCTVNVGQSEQGGVSVNVSSNSSSLTVPTQIFIPQGLTAGTFTATAALTARNQAVIVTAGRKTSSKTFTITIGQSGTLRTKLSCNTSGLTSGRTAACKVELPEPATSRTVVRLNTDNPSMTLPATVSIESGSSSANFTVRTRTTDQDSSGTIVAATDADSQVVRLSLAGVRPNSMSCSPRMAQAGSVVTCELRLNVADTPEALQLAVSSSHPSVKVPAAVSTRPLQSTLIFQAAIDAAAPSTIVSIEAAFGAMTVRDRVTVLAGPRPVLNAPEQQAARYGSKLSFDVVAASGSGLPVRLSTGSLPDGASFDPASGRFEWTPTQSQRGKRDLVFEATDQNNGSATAHTIIDVGAGTPAIDAVLHSATGSRDRVCAAGSLASIYGNWLSEDTAMDASGASLALAGTKVSVNGAFVPVVYASPTQVNFVCPGGLTGAALQVTVENESGRSSPVSVQLQDSAPGVFTVDGSGQAAVSIGDGSMLAMARNYRYVSEPAQAGDRLSILVTGLGSNVDTAALSVKIGDASLPVDSARPLAGSAGVTELSVTVPAAASFGDAVPLIVQSVRPDGRVAASQTVMIGIEQIRQ